MRGPRAFLPCFLLAAGVFGQPAPVPTRTYTDPTAGVSFSYPSVWKRVRQVGSYSQPALFYNGSPSARVIFEFTGDGNVYSKTDLESLDFLYGPVKASSAGACARQAGALGDMEGKPAAVTINGVIFTHGLGSEGSAGHSVSREAYTTFRDGKCLAFEEHFAETDEGVKDDSRPLTITERKALTRHLQAIMQTVTFKGVKP